MEPYYYSQMNKTQQNAYHAIKSGLLSMAASFAVPRVEDRELADIFFKLRLDCPEIFYGVGFRYRFYPNSSNVELIPEYLFDKGKVQEHQRAMNARIAKLIRPIQALPEWDQELYIHDFLCNNVRYDKLKKPYSHEIIGPLGQGVGVCEGMAKAVKILCDAAGIWCIIAISGSNPEKGIRYRHAWNIVRIGGTYYHLDVTFDNSISRGQEIRYDYFNLDEGRIFKDHEPVLYPVPQCGDGDHFYYRQKKLSFTKTEEVDKRALQAVKKGRTLTFHWRGGYLTREMLDELLVLLERTAQTKGKHVRVGLNWPQAVLAVDFTEEPPLKELIIDTVNEEER